MNLIKGKQIFFECYGSHFFIDREYGTKYKKCLVPKEIENIWKNEILDIVLNKINSEKGMNLVFFVDRYIDLVEPKSVCIFLMNLLGKKTFDTLTTLILLETFKNIINVNNLKNEEYLIFIENSKKQLMIAEISIDQSFYVINDETILNKEKILERINKL